MVTLSVTSNLDTKEDRVYVAIASIVDGKDMETLEKSNIIERVRDHNLHGSFYVRCPNGQTYIIPDTHRIDNVMLHPYLGEVKTWFMLKNVYTLQSRFNVPLTSLFYGKGNSVQLQFSIQRFNKKVLSADVSIFL